MKPKGKAANAVARQSASAKAAIRRRFIFRQSLYQSSKAELAKCHLKSLDKPLDDSKGPSTGRLTEGATSALN